MFLDRTPLFNLTDLVAKLPCNENAWLCQTAPEWRQALKESLGMYIGLRSRGNTQEDINLRFVNLAAYRTDTTSQPLLAQQLSQPTNFSTITYSLELYVEDRLRNHLLRSSQALQSMFTKQGQHGCDMSAPSDASIENISHLDEVINEQAYSQLGSRQKQDSLVHVLAILRHIPLVKLYQATGWRTDESGMASARTYLRQFLEQNGKATRRCLWHAAMIWTDLRHAQQFACYDTLAMCVAVCFLWSFARLGPQTQIESHTIPRTNTTGSQRSAVRVDKLTQKECIRKWISTGDDAGIYITGIGHLQGPGSDDILLNDAAKILSKQSAWSSLCHGLADAFMRVKNDMVNIGSE